MILHSIFPALFVASVLVTEGAGPPAPTAPPPQSLSARADSTASESAPRAFDGERFRQAARAWERRDLAGLERALDPLIGAPGPLAGTVTVLQARLAGARDAGEEAERLWQQVTEQPDSVFRGEAALELATRALARGENASADRWAERVASWATTDAGRAEALWVRSQAARAERRLERARALADELRDRFPRTNAASSAQKVAWSERQTVALTSASTALREVARLLGQALPAAARDLAREALERHPHAAEAPDLAYQEARAIGRSGGDEDAAMRAVRTRFPDHRVAREALYRLAWRAWNRDDDAAAAKLFEEFLDRHLGKAHSSDSIYGLARIHQSAGEWDEAATRYAELLRRYPKSDHAADVRWRLGWCHYQKAAFAEARAAFDEAASAASDTDDRDEARYWAARSAERAGQDATERYRKLVSSSPESYYARLALERLPKDRHPAVRVAPVPSGGDEPAPPTRTGNLERFEALRALDLDSWARSELAAYERATSSSAARDAFLEVAWQSVDGHHRALRIAARRGECALHAPRVRFCYPFGFRDVIEREAARQRLGPNLVAGLARQESAFQRDALSPANAVGLMQLLPATAERVAKKLGGVDPSDLTDPATNAALGTAYLRGLLDRYDGKVVRALAGYNAGERAVEKWIRRGGDLPDDEFVESITYRETRDYVKKVLRNERIYGLLYGP